MTEQSEIPAIDAIDDIIPVHKEKEVIEQETVELVIPAINPDIFDWNVSKRGANKYTKEKIAELETLYDQTFKQVEDNEIVKAVITAITDTDIILNIGFKSDGMISKSEFRDTPDLKVGDEVDVYVENKVSTFVAIAFIDKIGRKKLLVYGSILLCLDGVALAFSFYIGASGFLILLFVLGFIAVYSATLGPVTWVLLSEVFPNRIRSNAMALATLSLWIANFFTTASFPILREHFGLHVTFSIHAVICFMYFLFVMRKIPETKGKSLEEIERQLVTNSTGV